MTLSPAQMQQITQQWHPQFHDPEGFEKSVTRFLELVGDPTAEKLHNWLAKDQAKDELRHVAAPQEPLLPQLSRFDLNGCYHCYGRGFVRRDMKANEPDFGLAQHCPACRGRDGDCSSHCPKCADFWRSQQQAPDRNQCWKCRAFEDESAAEGCTNPAWHLPNAAAGAVPTLKTMLRRF